MFDLDSPLSSDGQRRHAKLPRELDQESNGIKRVSDDFFQE